MVGQNLVDALLRQGHDVYGVSRRSVNKNIKHYPVDLLHQDRVAQIIEEVRPDVIYHTAANAAESRGQISPIDMTERNINIFLNVLVPAINVKVKRFIYLSSVAVYGDAPTPYDEEDCPKPKDVYGVNKLACEQILKIMAKVHGIPYTIFRPHNIYGPHQDMTNPYKNVVALFMRSIMEDREVKIFGEGKMVRAFSYVEDVVDVLVCALDKKFENQTMNLGSEIHTSIADLLEMIEKIADKKAKKIMLPARPQEIHQFIAKRQLLNDLCTYKETPLPIGLKKTWEYINLPEIIKEADEIKTN